MSRVIKKDYANNTEILKVLQDYYASPIMVDDDGILANDAGRKIVKAGSILNKSGEIVDDGTARFVLLSDVDVTNGPRDGAGLYKAVIDTSKIPVEPTGEVVTALKGIFFFTEDYDYEVSDIDEDASILAGKVTALETTVGDATAGLVKDITDLETVVGDATAGLVKDVADLETVVGDATAGLVKDVADLKNA